MKKVRTSFALSEDALQLLKKLSLELNRSQANTIETLIKDAAKKEKIK